MIEILIGDDNKISLKTTNGIAEIEIEIKNGCAL